LGHRKRCEPEKYEGGKEEGDKSKKVGVVIQIWSRQTFPTMLSRFRDEEYISLKKKRDLFERKKKERGRGRATE